MQKLHGAYIFRPTHKKHNDEKNILLYEPKLKKGVTFMGYKETFKNVGEKVKRGCVKLFGKKDKRSSIEREIDNSVDTIKYYSPWSDEYSVTAANVEKLARAQAEMDEAKAKANPKVKLPPIDPTAIAVAAIGLVGTVGCTMLIIAAESESGLNEIIATKAISMIPKSFFKK